MLNRWRAPSFVFVCLVAGCGATEMREDETGPHGSVTRSLLLADFEGEHRSIDTLSGEWRTVNDNIMGGRSLGGGEIRDGVMTFRGSTNTNGGGFSSVRAGDTSWDLGAFDGLAARVRGDGRRYVFHVQTGLRSGGSEVFYRGSFETERLIDAEGREAADKPGWQEVYVPFAAFVPMIRGRDVSGRVGPLDPSTVRGIGLMIDDGLDGPFCLKADWIKAVAAAARADGGGDH